MPRNALQTVPEMRPTPRNAILGALADAMQAGKGLANRAQIPAWVPLVGGQGVGDIFPGNAPEELNEWSYGNAPMRINPLAGRTASYMPEMKRGRGQGVADLLAIAPSSTGRNALLTGAGMVDAGSAKAIFMGAKSKTWNPTAAERALAMEKSGVDPRAIWKETGTFKGPDGMWRQEIDDSVAALDSTGAFIGGKSGGGRVDQVMSHKGLFDAYPDVGGVPSRFHFDDATGRQGAYAGGRISVADPAGAASAKDIFHHELQHVVQEREGFARGGNPLQMGYASSKETQPVLDKIAQLENLMGKIPQSHPEYAAITKTYDELNNLLAQMADPINRYRRLAGEAEARAVQSRMDLNALQRQQLFPLDSYDVPVDQLIVRR